MKKTLLFTLAVILLISFSTLVYASDCLVTQHGCTGKCDDGSSCGQTETSSCGCPGDNYPEVPEFNTAGIIIALAVIAGVVFWYIKKKKK